MTTKKIATLLCIVALGSFSSCKKTTTTPDPVTPTPTPTPVNQLCDGNSTASYYPLDSTDTWVYLYKIMGVTQSPHPSPKVIGHVTYNSFKYAHIYDSALFSDTYLREDATTHNTYFYNSNNGIEYLEIPGTPTLNQTWSGAFGTRTVTNLSASKATSSCSYTGLLEITEVGSSSTTKYYYKKGLGKVYSIQSATSFPDEYTLTSTTLK